MTKKATEETSTNIVHVKIIEHIFRRNKELQADQDIMYRHWQAIQNMFGESNSIRCRICDKYESDHNEKTGHEPQSKIELNFDIRSEKEFCQTENTHGYKVDYHLYVEKQKLKVHKYNWESEEWKEISMWNNWDILKKLIASEAIPKFLDEIREEVEKRAKEFKEVSLQSGKLVESLK